MGACGKGETVSFQSEWDALTEQERTRRVARGERFLATCRAIVREHQARKVGGMWVDASTAARVVRIADALSEGNRRKLLAQSVPRGVCTLAWNVGG